MFKTIAATTLIGTTLFASSALAAPPADQDACYKLSFELADKAAAKKPADAAKVDEMIGKLEAQCTDGKFAEAEATAKDIEAAIGQ